MLTQIVTHTPIWVPFVFLGLLLYGLTMTRTRAMPVPRVVVPPVVFFLLSIGGVLSSFGPAPPALLGWMAGFGLAWLLNLAVPSPSGVTYDGRGRFVVPGSAVPLALMMLIFGAKYVVGATTAMAPDAVATPPFMAVLSAVFGFSSGTFTARLRRIWSSRTAPAPALEPAQ